MATFHGCLTATHNLGALAQQTFSQQTTRVDSSRLQGVIIDKLKLSMTYYGKTDGEGEILFGLSTGLTTSQLLEWLAADPQSSIDSELIEHEARKAYLLGIIPEKGTAAESGWPFHKMWEFRDFSSLENPGRHGALVLGIQRLGFAANYRNKHRLLRLHVREVSQ